MTVITVEKGYLESEPYLSGAYLTGKAEGNMGFQATIVNTDFETPLGMQAEITIEQETPLGMEAEITIVDFLDEQGMQAEITIPDFLDEQGMQAEIINVDFQNPLGMQAEMILSNSPKEMGFEAKIDTLSHVICGGYLVQPYLQDPYLVETMCAKKGMQAAITIAEYLEEQGMQVEITIADFLDEQGMQAEIIETFDLGMQATINIYNAKKLRILCEFPSRGTAANNWTASTTEPGDFDIENVDTDITEQIWRSATGVLTGITLTDDIGVGQQLFLDTFAMLNHNLTSSALVRLDGANNPGFSPVGFSEVLQVTPDEMYFIAPELPLSGFRFWRLTIDDATNSNGFIQAGAILFGASAIFPLQCGFTDRIGFERRDFADKIQTEGFTNISNSRALKKILRLEFRSQESRGAGFKILKNVFQTFRTTQKCLWIPTPSPTDQEITGKFAVFGKLSRLPAETHNNKGEPDNDFVDLTTEVDESL